MKEQGRWRERKWGVKVVAQEAAFEAGVTLRSSIWGCQASLSGSHRGFLSCSNRRRGLCQHCCTSGSRVSGLLVTMFQSGKVVWTTKSFRWPAPCCATSDWNSADSETSETTDGSKKGQDGVSSVATTQTVLAWTHVTCFRYKYVSLSTIMANLKCLHTLMVITLLLHRESFGKTWILVTSYSPIADCPSGAPLCATSNQTYSWKRSSDQGIGAKVEESEVDWEDVPFKPSHRPLFWQMIDHFATRWTCCMPDAGSSEPLGIFASLP